MKLKKEKKDVLELIRITQKTKHRIELLAKRKGLKQITILEYLLNGKIPLKEL